MTNPTDDELDRLIVRIMTGFPEYPITDHELKTFRKDWTFKQARKTIKANYISKEKVKAALNQVEKQGHGGGNWRRLFIEFKSNLGLDKE